MDNALTAGVDLVVNDKGLPEAIRKLGIDAEATRRRIEALASANMKALTALTSSAGHVDMFGDFAKSAEKMTPAAERANEAGLKLSQGMKLLAWQLGLPGSQFIFLGGVIRDMGKSLASVGVAGGLDLLKGKLSDLANTAKSAGSALSSFVSTPVGAALAVATAAIAAVWKVAGNAADAFNDANNRAKEWIKTMGELRDLRMGPISPEAKSEAENLDARAALLRKDAADVESRSAWWSPGTAGIDGDAQALRDQATAIEGMARARREDAEAKRMSDADAKARGEMPSDEYAKRIADAQREADTAGLEGKGLELANLEHAKLADWQKQELASLIELEYARKADAEAAKEQARADQLAAEEAVRAAERKAEAIKRAKEQEAEATKRADEQLSQSLRSPTEKVFDRVDELRQAALRGGITGVQEIRGLGELALSLLSPEKAAESAKASRGNGIESLESAYRRIEQAAATEQREAKVVTAIDKSAETIKEAIEAGDVKTIMESIEKSVRKIDKLGTYQ